MFRGGEAPIPHHRARREGRDGTGGRFSRWGGGSQTPPPIGEGIGIVEGESWSTPLPHRVIKIFPAWRPWPHSPLSNILSKMQICPILNCAIIHFPKRLIIIISRSCLPWIPAWKPCEAQAAIYSLSGSTEQRSSRPFDAIRCAKGPTEAHCGGGAGQASGRPDG